MGVESPGEPSRGRPDLHSEAPSATVRTVRFRQLTLDQLHIEDERSFRHVGLYEALKQSLRRDGYRFRVPEGAPVSWARALFLNLTYWDAVEQGDILPEAAIPADVVAHVAWHHLAARSLGPAGPDTLLFAEAIASAFDLFLVGRLLGHAPEAQFLATQVPAMAEVAEAAGLSEARFEALLQEVASDPDRAFEDLRELLFDAATTLMKCSTADAAAAALERFDEHRLGPLLHHYEISNWVLSARAAARDVPPAPEPGGLGAGVDVTGVQALDAALRAAPVALDHLERLWLAPPR
jgi:hypothetical protein